MAELTYLDMQARIARELRRSDLGREITDAIQDAIKHYKDERFAENVSEHTWPAVKGQREYALPNDFSRQVALIANYAGSGSEPLHERPVAFLDFQDQNYDPNSTGVSPYNYAVWGTNIVIYPRFAKDATVVSDGHGGFRMSDSIFMRYVSNLAPPDLDDDAGWWMNEAERLVRCHAKHTILADVLYVPEQAEYQLKLAEAEFERISEQGFSRAMPTQILPTPMI
jgi:hypothetical protein